MRIFYMMLPFLLAAMTVSFGDSAIPHVQKYLGDHYEICQDLEPVYGIPWEVKLAQGALESGWGRSRGYKEANAAFGITGRALHRDENGDPYYLSYVNNDGEARKYESLDWSFIDHSEYLLTRGYYDKCWECNEMSSRNRNVCWAKCIADSYLGPNAKQERKDWYGRTLISIMDKYIH